MKVEAAVAAVAAAAVVAARTTVRAAISGGVWGMILQHRIDRSLIPWSFYSPLSTKLLR